MREQEMNVYKSRYLASKYGNYVKGLDKIVKVENGYIIMDNYQYLIWKENNK